MVLRIACMVSKIAERIILKIKEWQNHLLEPI